MTEITTELLLRHRGDLGGVRIPFGEIEAFELLADKRKLYEVARALHIPVPWTVSVESPEALKTIVPELRFPVVVKPFRSCIATGGRRLRASVRYAASPRELEAHVRAEEAFRAHPFLIQERIRGLGHGVFALCEKGTAVTFFAHRRLRERPPSGGVSVLSESVAVDPLVREMSRRILDHVGWHGVAMVEFKVTAAGEPYLMEVNARFWGSLQLAIDAGVDFPWLLYRLGLGEPVEPVEDYRIGVRSRWLLGDLDHLYLRLRDDRRIRAKLGALASFFRWHGFRTQHEVDRWEDWRPFVVELKQYVTGLRGSRLRGVEARVDASIGGQA